MRDRRCDTGSYAFCVDLVISNDMQLWLAHTLDFCVLSHRHSVLRDNFNDINGLPQLNLENRSHLDTHTEWKSNLNSDGIDYNRRRTQFIATFFRRLIYRLHISNSYNTTND